MASANTKRRDDLVATLLQLARLIDASDKPTIRAAVRKIDKVSTGDDLGSEVVDAAVAILRDESEAW